MDEQLKVALLDDKDFGMRNRGMKGAYICRNSVSLLGGERSNSLRDPGIKGPPREIRRAAQAQVINDATVSRDRTAAGLWKIGKQRLLIRLRFDATAVGA
jgi:hypothetical protein